MSTQATTTQETDQPTITESIVVNTDNISPELLDYASLAGTTADGKPIYCMKTSNKPTPATTDAQINMKRISCNRNALDNLDVLPVIALKSALGVKPQVQPPAGGPVQPPAGPVGLGQGQPPVLGQGQTQLTTSPMEQAGEQRLEILTEQEKAASILPITQVTSPEIKPPEIKPPEIKPPEIKPPVKALKSSQEQIDKIDNELQSFKNKLTGLITELTKISADTTDSNISKDIDNLLMFINSVNNGDFKTILSSAPNKVKICEYVTIRLDSVKSYIKRKNIKISSENSGLINELHITFFTVAEELAEELKPPNIIKYLLITITNKDGSPSFNFDTQLKSIQVKHLKDFFNSGYFDVDSINKDNPEAPLVIDLQETIKKKLRINVNNEDIMSTSQFITISITTEDPKTPLDAKVDTKVKSTVDCYFKSAILNGVNTTTNKSITIDLKKASLIYDGVNNENTLFYTNDSIYFLSILYEPAVEQKLTKNKERRIINVIEDEQNPEYVTSVFVMQQITDILERCSNNKNSYVKDKEATKEIDTATELKDEAIEKPDFTKLKKKSKFISQSEIDSEYGIPPPLDKPPKPSTLRFNTEHMGANDPTLSPPPLKSALKQETSAGGGKYKSKKRLRKTKKQKRKTRKNKKTKRKRKSNKRKTRKRH